jgi:hypothetical protein
MAAAAPARAARALLLLALAGLAAAQNPGQFDRLASANSGFTGVLGAPAAPGAAAAPPPPPAVRLGGARGRRSCRGAPGDAGRVELGAGRHCRRAGARAWRPAPRWARASRARLSAASPMRARAR